MHNLTECYVAAVDSSHRRKHGQFFTPPEVAAFMCRWVLRGKQEKLFDPAFGLGSFYFAASSLARGIKFAGMELDAEVLGYFWKHAPAIARPFVVHGDYLSHWGESHKAIVCNPPYMRFQHFENRSEISILFERNAGTKLSGYTNIASAFLLKSLSELDSGGRLAYIMPLEFLNTGYGAIVKGQLLRRGMLKALIKLESEKEVFPDAITSIGIILVSSDGIAEPVRFYTVQHMEMLTDHLLSGPAREINYTNLDPSDKWLKYFEHSQTSFKSSDLVPVSFYGGFSRGIATGANEFFVMSPSKAEKLGIPCGCLLNCITKSAQIKNPIFMNSDFRDMESADANVRLLNAGGKLSEAVSKYLQYGEKAGYHLRYLTKMRTPWYKVEHRSPAPLLFGVFSRERFKVVRNLSNAVNLTCYHCFYPNLFGQRFCDALFLYLSCDHNQGE